MQVTFKTFLAMGWVVIVCCYLGSDRLLADGPADNQPSQVRPVPPLGIPISQVVRDELLQRVKEVRAELGALEIDSDTRAQIEVIPRAVEMTVDHEMFYADKELQQAKDLLELAGQRMQAVRDGRRGGEVHRVGSNKQSNVALVAGGFQSRLDGSIQPYGLVLPSGWETLQKETPLRLDVWLHGRGEKVSEVAFLRQRLEQVGEFTPQNTVVLHPYGRYCNAFKFAGEIDVLEAIEHVRRLYRIDERRITIRGFSMGGAGCWQLAVHYPDLWVAANPGAGFSETTQFLKAFQKEDFKPTAYQQRLLHWYDCPDWVDNLRSVPTVAYSGEVDNQKQAADVMEAAFKSHGMTLPHIIGPKAGHKILPESKPIIQQQLDASIERGKPKVPPVVDLTTYTLRYHQLAWLSIEGLAKHWEAAHVHAELGSLELRIQSKNLTRIRLEFSSVDFPFDRSRPVRIEADSQILEANFAAGSDVYSLWLVRDSRGLWTTANDFAVPEGMLVKRPGLTGPIDDAFMDAFIWVPPTKSAGGNWYEKEFDHATREWRRHFRGDVVMKEDLSHQEIANNHLILFGTPKTNRLLAQIADKLPVQWSDSTITFRGKTYDATTHAPVLIFPNPLNPNRYVVLNSGFTFREYAYLNNARQIAMLPDWAIVDFSGGANFITPGNVVDAGFFDENWR